MITDHDVDVFLEHHGVKGQKWGVRSRAQRVGYGTAKGIGIGVRTTVKGSKAIGRGAKKTAKWGWEHKKTVAAVAAGTIAAGILLKSHQNIKVKNLRTKHETFVKSKEALDIKMYRRMADLKLHARLTPQGHPSHEGALKEIQGLHDFYTARLSKMSSRHGIDAETFRKLKLGGFT